MKKTVFLLLITLLFANSLKSQQKLSDKQQKLSVFIKKYQDAIIHAPDSLSKVRIYYDMWKKHMVFIQDSLKFSAYPVYALDTFYFEKAFVEQTTRNKRKYIDVLLENRNYFALTSFDVTNELNLQSALIYRILISLKQNVPVLAVIHLQDFSLSDKNINKGIKRFILVLDLRAIYNIK